MGNLGWGVSTLVAVAAVVGMSMQHGDRPGPAEKARSYVSHKKPTKEGITNEKFKDDLCVEIEKRLQDFMLGEDRTLLVSPHSRYEDGRLPPDAATRPADLRLVAKDLKFVVATLSDPKYTHFSLSFDGMAEAIQEGESDAGYVYDSSRLPWDTDDIQFEHLDDQDNDGGLALAAGRTGRNFPVQTENCATFKRADSGIRPDLFDGGLVVIVVGEEPTQGIHLTQFKNATRWIIALRHNQNPA